MIRGDRDLGPILTDGGVPRTRVDPHDEMTRILMGIHQSPTQAKDVLRLDTGPNPRGRYQYGLFLDPVSDGQSFITLRAELSEFDPELWDLAERMKEVGETEGASLLRVGFLVVRQDEVVDNESAGEVPDTSLAMRMLLEAHFPDHRVLVQDIR